MLCSATSSLKHLVKWPNTKMLTLKKYFQIFTYRILLYYFCDYVYSTCKVHCTLRKLYHTICDVPDSIIFIVKEMFQFKESVCIHKCIFNYLKLFHLRRSKLKKKAKVLHKCSQMYISVVCFIRIESLRKPAMILISSHLLPERLIRKFDYMILI